MRKLALTVALFATTALAVPADAQVSLTPLGRYATGIVGKSAAEISAYDAGSKRLFVVNGADEAIDVLDISNPRSPNRVARVVLSQFGGGINSVASHNGLMAAAVGARDKTQPGQVVFFQPDGQVIKAVQVGALPDMLTFTPDGRYVLTANEGEPNDDFTSDPEGSISIIDLSQGVRGNTPVRTADFKRFDSQPAPEGYRIARRGLPLSQDVEPEYIAVSADSRTAYVTLQENNGLAVVDIAQAQVTSVVGLGFKDYRTVRLDPSDRDGGIKLGNWPVFGMYQPDAIAPVTVNGRLFLVTANEGDSRDYKGFSEEKRVSELTLDATAFPNGADLKKNDAIGRLRVTNQLGDTDGDGDFDRLYTFGGRSITVWGADGKLVWDSGDQLETFIAERFPKNFNANSDDPAADSRSDDKGPEPEGVAVGLVDGVPYAFVGLERIGGIMVFDMSNPAQPRMVHYQNDRKFDGDPKSDTAGELAPEGVTFIPAATSPTQRPLLVVTSEVSGSTMIYEVTKR